MIEAAERAHAQRPRAGVLLVNLGTPDAPTAPAIRRYLREFLSDQRVVDLPRALWWPILNGFILPFRPRRLAHSYGAIWTEDGAPLLKYTRELAQGVAAHLASTHADETVPVYYAMRYGNPSVSEVIERAQAEGVRRLVTIPLYPQYSATTTASVMDAVFAQLSSSRWMPELRSVHSYHDDPQYIEALANSVRTHWAEHGQGDHLLLSFHGIPKRYFESGDPYFCHCQKTARLVVEALQLPADRYTVAFQSRFGREPWLEPNADERIETLAKAGVKRLDAICPGFAADCLETLEEMHLQYGELFQRMGGEALRYIPALNAEAAHVRCISALAEQQLSGWIPSSHDAGGIAARAAQVSY